MKIRALAARWLLKGHAAIRDKTLLRSSLPHAEEIVGEGCDQYGMVEVELRRERRVPAPRMPIGNRVRFR